MIQLPSLYEHQQELFLRVRSSLAEHKRIILCAEPGFGKTRLCKYIAGSLVNKETPNGFSGKILFVVHRRNLVDNASDSFNESPALSHGVIMSGRDTDWSHDVYVGSIDTVLSWMVEDGEYKGSQTYDLIIFDESHSHFSKLKKLLKGHDEKRKEFGLKETFVIGPTATPEGKGLSDIFNKIVPSVSTQWLIENQFLSPFRYYQATEGKLDQLVMRAGEFTQQSVDTAMDGLGGDLVRDWKQYAYGRPTVGFFSRLSQAMQAKELLLEAGIEAAYVDGNTDDDERRRLFRFLESGDVEYICNVGVIERGTNIPSIACIQLCTAIGRLARYRQMIGRGSRTCQDKEDCIVLDHGGNIRRHGFFEDNVQWSLDVRTKATSDHAQRPTITCPKCQAIYRGGLCRACGYKPAVAERASQGLVFNGGELKEVTKAKKEVKSKTPEQVMIAALYATAKRNGTFKQATGMAYGMAKASCPNFKIPKTVTISGRDYRMVPWGSPDQVRKVRSLFEFLNRSYA